MKRLWIATGNAHKVQEFKHLLPHVQIEAQEVDVEENGTTFAQNALIKARALFERVKEPVLADDSGLEVDAMDGAPGVYSARWMGRDTDYRIKNQAIIDACANKDRTARYVCAIAYIDQDGIEHVYEGTCEGEIAYETKGENGFGYDPIFYYPPFKTTLADVSEQQKNEISHRALALKALLGDLQ